MYWCAFPILFTGYTPELLLVRQNDLLSSNNKNLDWNESIRDKNSIFVGMIEGYRNEVTTILDAHAIVTYPIDVVLLKFRKEFRRYLIHYLYTLAGLLPVMTFAIVWDEQEGYTENDIPSSPIVDVKPVSDELLTSIDGNRKQMKLESPPEVRQQILSKMNTPVWSGVQATASEHVCNSHPMMPQTAVMSLKAKIC